jgi:hypothetical protein
MTPTRRTLRRYATLIASLALIAEALAWCQTARAADGYGWTTCSSGPTDASCEVGARRNATRPPSATTAPRARTADPTVCHDPTGHVAPCYDPTLGALGSDGCYYKPSHPSPALQSALGGPGAGPGGWYDMVCPGTPGTGGGTVWLAGGPPTPAGAPAPAGVAKTAVSQLKLPRPVVGISPAGTQYVRVPTWLWIPPASWAPRMATATAGGVTVTATATPIRVMWSLGDGSTVTCRGPGTAWTPSADPTTGSSTCGHTYTQSSAANPAGVFSVTATITWTVSWAGGGQAGTVPNLTSRTTSTVKVAQVATVVTR